MPRRQFSIRTLLWLTLVVAAFLAGMLFERRRPKSPIELMYALEVQLQAPTISPS